MNNVCLFKESLRFVRGSGRLAVAPPRAELPMHTFFSPEVPRESGRRCRRLTFPPCHGSCPPVSLVFKMYLLRRSERNFYRPSVPWDLLSGPAPTKTAFGYDGFDTFRLAAGAVAVVASLRLERLPTMAGQPIYFALRRSFVGPAAPGTLKLMIDPGTGAWQNRESQACQQQPLQQPLPGLSTTPPTPVHPLFPNSGCSEQHVGVVRPDPKGWVRPGRSSATGARALTALRAGRRRRPGHGGCGSTRPSCWCVPQHTLLQGLPCSLVFASSCSRSPPCSQR